MSRHGGATLSCAKDIYQLTYAAFHSRMRIAVTGTIARSKLFSKRHGRFYPPDPRVREIPAISLAPALIYPDPVA